MKEKLEKLAHHILDKHPLIASLFIIVIMGLCLFFLINWLNQPMERIYDPNGPPSPCDIGEC